MVDSFEEWEAEQEQTPLEWLKEHPALLEDAHRLKASGKTPVRIFHWLVDKHGYPDTGKAQDALRNQLTRHT